MNDAQRIFRDLLKGVVTAVNDQSKFLVVHSDALTNLGNSIIGLQEVEARRWRKHVKQMRYDPSSCCCHGRKR